LLIYGYLTGVFSSRRIETATYDSIAFRFIAGNTHPDHASIAGFRKRFGEQFKSVFQKVLEFAHELKLVVVQHSFCTFPNH
jgi:transposase